MPRMPPQGGASWAEAGVQVGPVTWRSGKDSTSTMPRLMRVWVRLATELKMEPEPPHPRLLGVAVVVGECDVGGGGAGHLGARGPGEANGHAVAEDLKPNGVVVRRGRLKRRQLGRGVDRCAVHPGMCGQP